MLEIIRNGYIVFSVIAVILILALIGYISDHSFRKDVTIGDIKKEKEKLEKEKKEKKQKEDKEKKNVETI